MNASHSAAERAAPVAFIGGGNMAGALIGGLIRSGVAPADVVVVEPMAEQRAKLAAAFGLSPQPAADARLATAGTVVWAVKPQTFAEAAAPCAPFIGAALQVSVMAGIRTPAIARASGCARVVRAMPNTPALIGRGVAGLYATAAVAEADRRAVETLLAPTGQTLWVAEESLLDAVTAVSGSGPAYMFYLLEAMIQAGVEQGLPEADARAFALATMDGAAELARRSPERPEALRAQVTSKGGTTYAAISSMEADGVKAAIVKAVHAAGRRAAELGDEFGR